MSIIKQDYGEVGKSISITDTFSFRDITGQGSYQANSKFDYSLIGCKSATVNVTSGQNGTCYILGMNNDVETEIATLTTVSQPVSYNVDCSLYDTARVHFRSWNNNSNMAYNGTVERTF